MAVASKNSHYWDSMYKMRLSGSLCDIQLCVKDDMDNVVAIPAHKNVMVASSLYFSACLETNSLQDVFNLVGVSLLCLQKVLDYIYRQIQWSELVETPEAEAIASTLKVVKHDPFDASHGCVFRAQDGTNIVFVEKIHHSSKQMSNVNSASNKKQSKSRKSNTKVFHSENELSEALAIQNMRPKTTGSQEKSDERFQAMRESVKEKASEVKEEGERTSHSESDAMKEDVGPPASKTEETGRRFCRIAKRKDVLPTYVAPTKRKKKEEIKKETQPPETVTITEEDEEKQNDTQENQEVSVKKEKESEEEINEIEENSKEKSEDQGKINNEEDIDEKGVVKGYPAVLDSLGDAAQLVYTTESSFVRHGFVSQGNTSLIELEKQLLELASYEGVTQGVFYMLRTSSRGSSLIRYFESGSFLGFLHHQKGTAQVPPGFEDPLYRIYNEEDIEEERSFLLKRRDSISRKRTSGHPKEGIRNRSGERYTRYLRQLKTHLQSVKETASSSENHADVTHLYIHILRKNASANNKDHNYVHSIGMQPLEQELLDKALQDARLQGPYPYPFPSRTSLQSAETPLTMQQQLDALCTLSNHPSRPFPKHDRQLSVCAGRRGFLTYLSYQPPRDKSQPDLQPKHLPSSHRNRFIYFGANARAIDRAVLLQYIFRSREQQQPTPTLNEQELVELGTNSSATPRTTTARTFVSLDNGS